MPPPPHLSPFVDNVQEGYMPNRQKEINNLKGEEYEEVGDDSEEEMEPVEEVTKAKPKQKGKSKEKYEEKP